MLFPDFEACDISPFERASSADLRAYFAKYATANNLALRLSTVVASACQIGEKVHLDLRTHALADQPTDSGTDVFDYVIFATGFAARNIPEIRCLGCVKEDVNEDGVVPADQGGTGPTILHSDELRRAHLDLIVKLGHRAVLVGGSKAAADVALELDGAGCEFSWVCRSPYLFAVGETGGPGVKVRRVLRSVAGVLDWTRPASLFRRLLLAIIIVQYAFLSCVLGVFGGAAKCAHACGIFHSFTGAKRGPWGYKFGTLPAEDIRKLSDIFARRGVVPNAAGGGGLEVACVSAAQKKEGKSPCVIIDGRALPCDVLLLATGSTHAYPECTTRTTPGGAPTRVGGGVVCGPFSLATADAPRVLFIQQLTTGALNAEVNAALVAAYIAMPAMRRPYAAAHALGAIGDFYFGKKDVMPTWTSVQFRLLTHWYDLRLNETPGMLARVMSYGAVTPRMLR